MQDLARFFLGRQTDIIDKMDTLSRDREIHQASVVAQRATEFLSLELAPGKPMPLSMIRKFLGPLDKGVGKCVTWVGLIRAIDFLNGL